MEISTAVPPSLSLPTNTNTPKSPDTDQAETPTTTRIQPTKSLPFTNGVLKRHPPLHLHHHNHQSPATPPHLHHHNHQPPATPPPPVSYKECMKNHAAPRGGYALDGCCEFMPSPAAVATDPTSLKCAACGCHRNFHRRETPASAGEDHHPLPLAATPTTHVIEYHPHHRHHPPPPPHGRRSPNSQSPPPISSSYYPSSAPHMLLALSGGGGGNNPSAAMEALTSPHSTTPFQPSRKRFRTKFTQDQKERMHEFAEKLGWKMQKTSEDLVAEFCNEVGVERAVFKVWMHNNKNTFGKRDLNGNVRDSTEIAQRNISTAAVAATNLNDNNGSSGNSGNNESRNGSHVYSKNGDGTYGSSTSS